MTRNIFLEAFLVTTLVVGIAAYYFGRDFMAVLSGS